MCPAAPPSPGPSTARAFDYERLQLPLGLTAGLSLALGFLASVDVFILPRLPQGLAWTAHVFLALAAFAAGWLLVLRLGQIEAERWRVVEDPDPRVTHAERDHAHKEAESDRRSAGLLFFLSPTFLGYWLAYQFGGGSDGPAVANLLIVTPFLGFVVGLLLAQMTGRGLSRQP